jgi:hypothetical protein
VTNPPPARSALMSCTCLLAGRQKVSSTYRKQRWVPGGGTARLMPWRNQAKETNILQTLSTHPCQQVALPRWRNSSQTCLSSPWKAHTHTHTHSFVADANYAELCACHYGHSAVSYEATPPTRRPLTACLLSQVVKLPTRFKTIPSLHNRPNVGRN